MLDPIFAERHFPPEIILWAARWYCRYPLAYRMVEEMLKERGVEVDHATVAHWVQEYGPEIERRLRSSHPVFPAPGGWMRLV